MYYDITVPGEEAMREEELVGMIPAMRRQGS